MLLRCWLSGIQSQFHLQGRKGLFNSQQPVLTSHAGCSGFPALSKEASTGFIWMQRHEKEEQVTPFPANVAIALHDIAQIRQPNCACEVSVHA